MAEYAVLSGLLMLAGLAAGWVLGHPLGGLIAGLVGLVVFLLLQARRLHAWVMDSDRPPPDLPGSWGQIVSRIVKREQLAEAERDRLQSLVDYLLSSFASMRDAVVILEHNGAIKWCNDSATTLLGLRYPDDTVRGISSLVRQPEFTRYLQAAEFERPLRFSIAGDTERHLQVSVSLFGEGDLLLFVRDVTELARMERIRRDFVANVSHELRTPLTVITGYLDTFQGEGNALPQGYQKPLQQMAQQAERMESMLKDLLWLSRIESEEQLAKREWVDMAGLLEELREELRNVFPGRSLEMQLEARYCVVGDYRELYSAVSNLVHNAFKYSPEDTPVVVAWCKRGSDCLLTVTDEGVGIDPGHFDRLTERFYRVDDSRSSSTGGTGLGLAIVKHVAVAHGASLEVESVVGGGSTFTLRFPEGVLDSDLPVATAGTA